MILIKLNEFNVIWNALYTRLGKLFYLRKQYFPTWIVTMTWSINRHECTLFYYARRNWSSCVLYMYLFIPKWMLKKLFSILKLCKNNCHSAPLVPTGFNFNLYQSELVGIRTQHKLYVLYYEAIQIVYKRLCESIAVCFSQIEDNE